MDIEFLEDNLENIADEKCASVMELILSAVRDYPLFGLEDTDVYFKEVGGRIKYPGEQAIMINNREGVPTVNGNPNDPKGAPVADQTLTRVFIHQGNTGRESLTTTKGVAISKGCQTCVQSWNDLESLQQSSRMLVSSILENIKSVSRNPSVTQRPDGLLKVQKDSKKAAVTQDK